jgi:hypothetical protein
MTDGVAWLAKMDRVDLQAQAASGEMIGWIQPGGAEPLFKPADGLRSERARGSRAMSAGSMEWKESHSGGPKWSAVIGGLVELMGVRTASARVGVTSVQLSDRGSCSSAATVNAVADFQAMNSAMASRRMARFRGSDCRVGAM